MGRGPDKRVPGKIKSEDPFNIAHMRVARDFTQEQLAERMGAKQSTVARLEAGKYLPRLSTLNRVADALGGKVVVSISVLENECETRLKVS